MSELKRGLISVGILVLVISIVYLVIQNYKESKLSNDSNQVQTESKEEEQKQQQQQDPEAKLQAEKDKVDTLVTAIENNTDTVNNTTSSGESPF
jgi:septal ring factor EnvC (AmiA/AmiB activator)